MKLERFSHSNTASVVYLDNNPLAWKSNRGWCRLPSGDEVIDRATDHAIVSCHDNVSAEELRRAITDFFRL